MLMRITAALILALAAWPQAGSAQNVGPLYPKNGAPAAASPTTQPGTSREERHQQNMQRIWDRAYLDRDLTPAESFELRRTEERHRRETPDADAVGTVSNAPLPGSQALQAGQIGEGSRDYTGAKNLSNTPAWALPANRQLPYRP
jgi:hypothetical protein